MHHLRWFLTLQLTFFMLKLFSPVLLLRSEVKLFYIMDAKTIFTGKINMNGIQKVCAHENKNIKGGVGVSYVAFRSECTVTILNSWKYRQGFKLWNVVFRLNIWCRYRSTIRTGRSDSWISLPSKWYSRRKFYIYGPVKHWKIYTHYWIYETVCAIFNNDNSLKLIFLKVYYVTPSSTYD